MELINKEFNVWACSITELTFEDIEGCLKPFKDKRLADFAFTYDRSTGKIVLIKEFAYFELYAYAVPDYLGADEEEKQNIRSVYDEVIPKDNFDIFDMAVEEQGYRDVMLMIGKQTYDTYLRDRVVDFIASDIENKTAMGFYMFNYGIILGKRMERQKKKTAKF